MKPTHYELAAKLVPGIYGDKKAFVVSTDRLMEGVDKDDFLQFGIRLSEASPGATSPAGFILFSQMMYHAYHWLKDGEKIYEVSDSLAWMLAHTETNVDVEMVMAPFSSLYIIIPDYLFTMLNAETGIHKVSAFYVKTYDQDGFRWFRILAVGEPNSKERFEGDDCLFYFKLKLDRTAKIKDELARNMAEAREEPDSWLKMAHGTLEAATEARKSVPKFFNFIMNVLLYCTSAEADVEWHPEFRRLWDRRKRVKKQHQIDRVNQELARLGAPRRVLGSKIVISRQDKEDYMQSFRTGKTTIGVRFQVSGHWRQQWYGSEKENNRCQKAKWIRPYWKGPEAADIVNKVRELRE